MENEFWLDDETSKLAFTQHAGSPITIEEAHVLALQQIAESIDSLRQELHERRDIHIGLESIADAIARKSLTS